MIDVRSGCVVATQPVSCPTCHPLYFLQITSYSLYIRQIEHVHHNTAVVVAAAAAAAVAVAVAVAATNSCCYSTHVQDSGIELMSRCGAHTTYPSIDTW